MTEAGPTPPPEGFTIGHWTHPEAPTGTTAILAPPGTRGGADVRGGGPGTREIDVIGPLSAPREVSGVIFSGGSAYGLAAADGAMRWLEENGRGHRTPAGLIPLVPAAVIFDFAAGDPATRPGPEAGYAACSSATPGVPPRGRLGAGAGAAVGKLYGRDQAVQAGIGYAAATSGRGEIVAALAVANGFGDVLAEDGAVLAGPRREDGGTVSTREEIAAMAAPPEWTGLEERNTTLACVMTDAPLGPAGCARVARMASGGIARAVDPVYSDVDGDVAFCLASGSGAADRFTTIAVGTIAAAVTAAAIRDAVRAARD